MQHQQKNEISNFVHSTENTPLMVDFKNYDSIVSTYRKIVELCPRYEEVKDDDYFIFEDDTTHDLYNTIFSSALHLYPRDSSGINGNCYEQFGYTIKDLKRN